MTGAESAETTNIAVVQANLAMPFSCIYGGLQTNEAYLSAVGADGMQITPVHFSPLVAQIVRRGRTWEGYERTHEPMLEARGPTGSFGHDLVNSLFDAPEPRRTYADEATGRILHSVHQSFRDDIRDNGLVAQAFPRWPRSLRQMEFMQAAARRSVPAVLYPIFRSGKLIEYSNIVESVEGLVHVPFEDRTYQPTAEVFRAFGLTEDSSTEDIAQTTYGHGYSGMTWDSLWSQSFRDPLALCDRLASAGLLRSFHLSVGRKDAAQNDPELAKRSMQADAAFMASPEAAARTLEGEMLLSVTRGWKQQPLRYFTDTPPVRWSRSIVLEKPYRKNASKSAREDRATFENVRALAAAA